jgi:NitT/TauT family transport system permease protein/sulfonate transport system permease protein
MIKKATGFLFILFLLSFVEGLCRLSFLDPVYFPPPSVIISGFINMLGEKNLWSHIGHTIFRTTLGFGLAMLIAIPSGLLVGEFRSLRNLLEPTIEMLRPMPSAAIIPVAILIFGIEDEMKIAVIIFGSIWATIISSMDGIRNIDPLMRDTGKILQLTKLQMLTKIILPAVLPTVFTGMRISLAIALILTVTSEMIAGTNGLGYFILDTQRSFDFSKMFVGIIWVGIIGFVFSKFFIWTEKRILFWNYTLQNGKQN